MTASILERRAELLAQIRSFFGERGFTEVSTPTVDAEIIPELHIEPFEAPGLGYLQASPEMHLKQLLCAGSGPIFEIANCFRRDERGPLHRPEFTMVEWYRPGDDMPSGMDLLAEFVQTMLGTPAARKPSYRQAFVEHLKLDPHTASLEQIRSQSGNFEPLPRPLSVERPFLSGSGGRGETCRDELLNLLLAKHIEPKLGVGRPEILYHYPASQSALATVATDELGVEVAERFELYYGGIELANGYYELTDAHELRERLTEVNSHRVADGRGALPLPEKLLAAMQSPGLPPCAGVALGFDRLLMLSAGAASLDELYKNTLD